MDSGTRARRILESIAAIPAGRVASYGQVAELAGLPRGARLVGYVLRTSGGDAAVPWHRVLRNDGRIAFPAASREYREQERRLRAEDVTVREGRVDMPRYRWQPDLDELLWKPSPSWDES